MGKKIIVVDDSRIVRQQVKMALGEAEFEVIEAQDGVEGLERLGQHRDAAMMICDVNMPRMNGLDMIEAVKRDPMNNKLPVVMLTTEGQADLIDRAKRAGAKGWIVKPFKPELLLAAVKKLTGAQGA